MARTRTKTASHTTTHTRLSFLLMQIRSCLRRSSDISEDSLQSIEKGLNNKWIAQIHVEGYDIGDRVNIDLILEIDWKRHEIHISQGRNMVEFNSRDGNNVVIELDEALRFFMDYVESHRLFTRWFVRYSSGFDVAMIDRELGFGRVPEMTWTKGDLQRGKLQPREIDELGINLRFVE